MNKKIPIANGAIVNTPGGRAKVIYHRMSDFDKNQIGFYAVKLDNAPEWSKINSIYSAKDVSKTE